MMSLKKAIKESERKAKLFPKFFVFWKGRTPKERKKIYKDSMGRDIKPEMHKEEYANLLSLDEIVEIMDFCEV